MLKEKSNEAPQQTLASPEKVNSKESNSDCRWEMGGYRGRTVATSTKASAS